MIKLDLFCIFFTFFL